MNQFHKTLYAMPSTLFHCPYSKLDLNLINHFVFQLTLSYIHNKENTSPINFIEIRSLALFNYI